MVTSTPLSVQVCSAVLCCVYVMQVVVIRLLSVHVVMHYEGVAALGGVVGHLPVGKHTQPGVTAMRIQSVLAAVSDLSSMLFIGVHCCALLWGVLHCG
jgi:hypothetical protein